MLSRLWSAFWWIAESLDKGWTLICMERISSLQKCRCPRTGGMQRIYLVQLVLYKPELQVSVQLLCQSTALIRLLAGSVSLLLGSFPNWWPPAVIWASASFLCQCKMILWGVWSYSVNMCLCPKTLIPSDLPWCKKKKEHTHSRSYLISYCTSQMCPDTRISVRQHKIQVIWHT